jgi:glycosyltransferase involved in cell wall biosynthesis
MKIVLWIPELSYHFLDMWLAVQQEINEPIHVVARERISTLRIGQGLAPHSYEGIDAEILSMKNWWDQGKRIIQKYPGAIHVFWGFWSIREYFPLLLYALLHGIKTVIANEPYSTSYEPYFFKEAQFISWFKVKMRPLLYRFMAVFLKVISKEKQLCFLSLSLLAREQFIRAGFNKDTLFPFGYFIWKQNVVRDQTEKDKNELKLIFVGALIKRKGLDIAVSAIETLYNKGYRVSLDLYGAGNPDPYCSSSKCIHYKGILPQGEAQKTISSYDFLLLPSRHDGWGIVVNEALLQGVPVIASDHVGAICLLESTGAGIVFKSQDSVDLQNKIESLLFEDNKVEFLKGNASKVASQILPNVAAIYLLDVLKYYFFDEGEKPDAIWCR